jgi:prophage regulatory protein
MKKEQNEPSVRIIRKPEALKMLGVSDCTIWRWERAGSFPKRISLGANSTGWFEHEIREWLEKRRRAASHIKMGYTDDENCKISTY